MYDQEQIIQIYRQGFFICAGLSVVGGIMTTIFFLKFGIRRIIAVRTGYEARKEIRRIEEENRKKETKTSDVFVLKTRFRLCCQQKACGPSGLRLSVCFLWENCFCCFGRLRAYLAFQR